MDPAHARRWDLFEDLGGRFGSNGLGLLPEFRSAIISEIIIIILIILPQDLR